MTMTEKYLQALESMQDWTTVSEWAIAFAEIFPDLLEKANQEASSQKNETTGLRELAARISSRLSVGAFGERVEIDNSDKPRRVRFVTSEIAKANIDNEIEEDLGPLLTREQIIKSDLEFLSTKEQYRLTEMKNIIGQLKLLFNLDFEFEHSKAIRNSDQPGRHHPDNIQILLRSHNRFKSSKNWERFTIDEQIDYILAVVEVQKKVAKKMDIDLDQDVIASIIQRIKSVY